MGSGIKVSVKCFSVQFLSCVWLFVTPWTTARQASLSITNFRSLPKLMSIKSVMPSSHLILYYLLLLLPPIPPSIRVFSSESTVCIRWPKYWSFSFSISPSNEHPGLISFRMDWLDLLAVQGTHLKRPWCWERLRAGEEGDDRGGDGWMASPTQWTWVCHSSCEGKLGIALEWLQGQ